MKLLAEHLNEHKEIKILCDFIFIDYFNIIFFTMSLRHHNRHCLKYFIYNGFIFKKKKCICICFIGYIQRLFCQFREFPTYGFNFYGALLNSHKINVVHIRTQNHLKFTENMTICECQSLPITVRMY